jgi:hypothetical protein
MTEVVVRDKCALISLTCFHETDDDGQPACRQGGKVGASFTTVERDELPEGVEKCDYCDDNLSSTKSCNNPNTLAYQLEQASATEVLGE